MFKRKYAPRKCQLVKCKTLQCKNQVSIYVGSTNKKKFYCNDCLKEHDVRVLELQVIHEQPIKGLLLSTAQMFNFKSLSAISDYLESPIHFTRFWIRKYYGLEWDLFKQKYYCKVSECEKVDIADIQNRYYLSRKLKTKDICNCLGKDNSMLIYLKNDNDIKLVEKLLSEM